MGQFNTALDIYQRAAQHLGSLPLVSTTDNRKEATAFNLVYDKVRRAELRRNVWRFSTRKAILRAISPTTMVLAPAAWVAGQVYFPGELVSYLGVIYQCNTNSNQGDTPDVDASWDVFFGCLNCDLWTTTTPLSAFYAGEIVYVATGAGQSRAYLSLVGNNTTDPRVPTQWSAYTAATSNPPASALGLYNCGDVVQGSNGYWYRSLFDQNYGNNPTLSPIPYNANTSYASAALVAGIDGLVYSSLVSSNAGHEPTTDGGVHWQKTGAFVPWTPAFAGPTGGLSWIRLGGTLSTLKVVYPVGSGPDTGQGLRNVFRLPNGFLREAPQDPKAGSVSGLGAPSGLAYNDWNLEGNYLVTTAVQAIVYRFGADVADVTLMDDMFCEALAARMAMETCEVITQSSSKFNTIRSAYLGAISEARAVNGIETGSVEPPEDDYIECRA